MGNDEVVAVQTRSRGVKFTIISSGDTFDWVVPCFPVLTIHFVKLGIEIDGKKCNGVISQGDFYKLMDKDLPLEGICDTHCHISISDSEFIVLWKWEIFAELKDDCESDSENSSIVTHISETDMSNTSDTSIGDVNLGGDEDSSDDDDDFPVYHTLPFKVMGVAHSNHSQTHLMRAEAKLYTDHEHVSVQLVPEPLNERDSNAISVQIDYGEGLHHVGYISKELTQFIHPLLKDNAIANLEIGHIRFCLKWLRIGFYMKLLITRRGRWEPFVVAKAMRVS